MKTTKIIKQQTFICDHCGVEEIVNDKSSWLTVMETETPELRLFEKPGDDTKYESFHIPNKLEKNYCSPTCAIEHFKVSMQVFLAGLSPIARSKKFKRFAK